MDQPRVAIVIGSKSDADVMAECSAVLKELGISCETRVLSAHRSPDRLREFVLEAPSRGVEVFVAAAGMAAALPGVIAAHTTLPVIGVPIVKAGMSGLDALLSISQMPPGVPVACMALNGARNAGLFAAAILALQDKAVASALDRYRREQSSA